MSDNPIFEEAAFAEQSPRHTALRIAAIYASISVMWILFSDQLLSILVKNIDAMTRIQMVKGWFFVFATSYLIFFLLQKDLKKHGQAEKALRHSQAQLVSLMDAIPAPVSWADDQGNIKYSNNKFRELFGYTLEEMPTVEQWFQLAYPDQGYRQTVTSSWQIAVENAMHSGPEIAPIEVTITCKDGSTRYVAIIGTLFHNRILVVFNDLTESKRAEKALEESENRYRMLFNSANDAIIIMQDNLFVECNQKALEMYGGTREQIIGKPPYKFSPSHQPDGRDSTEKAFEKITKAMDGQAQVFEWQHKRLNDEVFDAEISLSLIEIESEKFILAIARDISERKRLGKELQLMQRWVEQSVDLFFWVREDSQILYVNQAVCHSMGYTLEELRTMKVSGFDLGIPLEAWSDFSQRLRNQGSHFLETRLRKKNGQVFPVEISANVVNYEGKDHFFAYGRDITERKRLESRLIEAQKLEAIGTLAGGIAHDFNNILSPIMIYTELVLMDLPEDSLHRSSLEKIFQASERARDLVKHILAFSRQQEVEPKPLKIGTIIKEVIKLIRASIPSTIEIQHAINASNDTVLADPVQVHQILMNLCTNAFHAMRTKGGTLTVNLETIKVDAVDNDQYPALPTGHYAKLIVSDTGHGMTQDVMQRIFEPYYTTKAKGEGTGLGLATVHGIVKSYGGSLTVKSEPGVGTVFNLFFPVIEYTETTEMTALPVKGGNERILIVDDEEQIINAMVPMLKRLGYHVTAQTSSSEALKILKQNPQAFDVLITDMTMPEMTGKELSVEAKRIRSDIPIILCTGFSDTMDAEAAKTFGIDAFLIKPVVRGKMAETIRAVIKKKMQ